jgi:hypothetical protein
MSNNRRLEYGGQEPAPSRRADISFRPGRPLVELVEAVKAEAEGKGSAV